MKKIFLSLFVCISFLVFLSTPVFLNAYAKTMTHHGEKVHTCLEHCVQSDVYLKQDIQTSSFLFQEFILIKIFFEKITEISIPLTSIFLLICCSPPLLHRNIKNYHFGLLKKIIVSNT